MKVKTYSLNFDKISDDLLLHLWLTNADCECYEGQLEEILIKRGIIRVEGEEEEET